MKIKMNDFSKVSIKVLKYLFKWPTFCWSYRNILQIFLHLVSEALYFLI